MGGDEQLELASNSPPVRERDHTSGSFDYFPHDADIGVIGHGPTPEAAMEQAARAMFALMGTSESSSNGTVVRFSFDEPDLVFALVTWLNRALAEANAVNISASRLSLRREGSTWNGSLAGSVWQPETERGVEVKGATLTEASVERIAEGWEARCVVDV